MPSSIKEKDRVPRETRCLFAIGGVFFMIAVIAWPLFTSFFSDGDDDDVGALAVYILTSNVILSVLFNKIVFILLCMIAVIASRFFSLFTSDDFGVGDILGFPFVVSIALFFKAFFQPYKGNIEVLQELPQGCPDPNCNGTLELYKLKIAESRQRHYRVIYTEVETTSLWERRYH